MIKVFYDPQQSSPKVVLSPSATKPKLLVERWLSQKRPIELTSFEPVDKKDFYLAHDIAHVDEVLSGKKMNGFGDKSLEVAATFPWTTGSLYAAAKHAFENKTFTSSLTSGFHHAGYSHCRGFCTFNGLMVTAIKLLHENKVTKIGIIDCDVHYGDGTADIIKRFQLDDCIQHYTFGAEDKHNPDWKGDKRADEWLTRFPAIIEEFKGCDLIIYQAGADAHADDPLGGAFTTEQMRQRDKILFSKLKELGIPAAWCLAGGYQWPIEIVLGLHDITLEECLANMLC